MAEDFPAQRAAMVEQQLRRRGIRDQRVLTAMARVPRELFVPAAIRHRAYEDCALPIGAGQTISQPLMVARICELAELKGIERVLDVGCGSGYQSAVLSHLAAKVIGVERIPALAASAQKALRAAGYPAVEVLTADGTRGLPDRAPFDRVTVAAGAPEIPAALYDQLNDEGIIIAPVGSREVQNLVVVRRGQDGPERQSFDPCTFVPLLGDQGWPLQP